MLDVVVLNPLPVSNVHQLTSYIFITYANGTRAFGTEVFR